jgi:hypothetical protein
MTDQALGAGYSKLVAGIVWVGGAATAYIRGTITL